VLAGVSRTMIYIKRKPALAAEEDEVLTRLRQAETECVDLFPTLRSRFESCPSQGHIDLRLACLWTRTFHFTRQFEVGCLDFIGLPHIRIHE